MSLWRVRLLLLLSLVLSYGCALVQLPDETFVTPTPGSENAVLPSDENPRVTFAASVNRSDAEAIFSVEDNDGNLSGSFEWSGRTLEFRPEPELEPGVRYTLRFSGEFRDAADTPRSAFIVVPFFSGSSANPLRLALAVPASGSIITPTTPIELRFSAPIALSSVAGRISVSPNTDRVLTWSDDNQSLAITPLEAWDDTQVYTITLDEDLESEGGFRLPEQVDLTYLVQEDIDPPLLSSVDAALNDPPNAYPVLGSDLSLFLGPRDVLRFTFSEPMDQDSVESALRITPNDADSPIWIDGRTVIYPPEDRWDSTIEYVYYFEGAPSDVAGNVLDGANLVRFTPSPRPDIDFRVTFTREAPPVQILAGAFDSDVPVDIEVGPPLDGQYTFDIEFLIGSFITDSEKTHVLNAINVSAVFPGTIGSPLLTGFSWSSDNDLSLSYTGFGRSPAGSEYLYALEIGVAGDPLTASNGAQLREPVRQLLRARP